MCQLLRGIDVSFHQFLDRSWTEVPSPSLTINEISSTIQNESQRTTNNVVKSQRTKTYLTLIFISIYFTLNHKEVMV